MKSFALLKTNVGLTTNIKIMINSNYNLSLSSIESNDELSNSKYKKVSFVKENYYDELINYFYDKLPSDTAFNIKYDNDIDSMSTDYASQYNELYQYGARNIANNKEYSEEYEYFAPLYISPNKLPKNFIIFRVDGSGIDNINKDNVKKNIFNNFKTVKLFDLTKNSILGEWLDINFNNNYFFPLTSFEMSFDNLEFSKWNGIDYETGGYTSKSLFFENIYREEKEIYEFEKFIFDGYKNNKIVYPNILNLSFLYDDAPANEDGFRKWSLNRYYGFYLDDMVKVKSISPYITPFIKNNVVIQSNNILYSPDGDPFVDGFSDQELYYIEYQNEYYKVVKFEEEGKITLQNIQSDNIVNKEYRTEYITRYKIISDINLENKEKEINKNIALIGSDIQNHNMLLTYDNEPYTIIDWSTADIWLIKIDDMYHNLIKNKDGNIIINSDYSFLISENEYKYWINKNDPTYTTTTNFTPNINNPPKKFDIYKLNFTDIKDFDTKIIDTEYSKYEYEKKSSLTETDETKMYLTNLNSISNPKNYDDFILNENVVNIPVSSEYTANYETFKISNGNLSDIWRINSVYCRWGFKNSISSNDMPYLLNNSLLFEDYNRTVNPFDQNPNRIERNLDYFYTINSSTASYIHHSLHIENQNNADIDLSFKFELDKYLNLGTYSIGTYSATYSFDYFTYFFDRNAKFDNGEFNKNIKKYSILNKGNNTIPNITLFRGIKFLIYDVADIKKDVETKNIEVLNLKTENTFDDYKFSILLSDNDYTLTDSNINNLCTLTQSQNSMNWIIFNEWEMDKNYSKDDIVIKDDILYIATNDNITLTPLGITASLSSDWAIYSSTFSNIFWNPDSNYSISSNGIVTDNKIVYNAGDYYCYIGGTDDFWKQDNNGYPYGDTVLFNGKYYISMTSSNTYRPDYSQPFKITKEFNIDRTKLDGTDVYDYIGSYYWVATQSTSPKWKMIEIWNPSTYYSSSNTYIVHNDIVYSTTLSQTGNEPGISSDWKREYSLEPDTSIIYSDINNPIIKMNNSYYMIKSNTSNSTLQNGINIYINKKWKNILINIDIADNTIPGLSETDRDYLYNKLNSKLTAYNFIQCFNNISNKYGFSDYINYIIIDENNIIKKYNYNSIDGIPYYIMCETPDEINMKHDSLTYIPINLPKDIKPQKVINNNISQDLSNLNYYNSIPISANIKSNEYVMDIQNDTIYRFSGFYEPIFYDIQLFEKNFFSTSVGNYIFDTNLTEFGLIKERKIRKINHKGSVLKLNNIKDQISIYPMLQEFGYLTTDSFIFKSTWDIGYHICTSTNPNLLASVKSKETMIKNINTIGIQEIIKNISL